MITNNLSIGDPSISRVKKLFSLVTKTLKIYFLSNYQIYNIILLITVTMLYMKSS